MMQPKTMLLLYNPNSGKADFKQKLSDVVDLYTKNGYIVTVCPTQQEKDATNMIAHHAGKYELVVCSGGDGTFSEVISGLMTVQHPPVVGYIPSGTTNDFAASLHIPTGVMDAAQTVMHGTPFACDVGSFNGETFGYIAAFGLFTDVAYQTPQEIKNVLGRMAYLLEGAKRLGSIPSYPLTIETETETITDEFIYGMVTNSTSVGGFHGLRGDKVKLDDGLFEVILARKPKNVADIGALLQCIVTATPDPQYLYACRASKVIITSETPIDWTLDGEFGGSTAQAVMQNHKQAITVMVEEA